MVLTGRGLYRRRWICQGSPWKGKDFNSWKTRTLSQSWQQDGLSHLWSWILQNVAVWGAYAKASREEPYKCTVDKCQKTYARANLLTAHLKDAHQNRPTTYHCEEPNCNKIYTAIRSLNYHIRRQHTEDNEFNRSAHICEKCGKSYGRKAHLTRHQWVHKSKGDFNFSCDYCDQRFYTNQNLQDHVLRSHSYKQPFRCRRCGRIFKSRIALSIHMNKSHSKSNV